MQETAAAMRPIPPEATMPTAADIARYILENQGPMSAMKLQKLAYYAQAWSLVWDDRPLFSSRIEAWANGPVAPDLYRAHRGKFQVAAADIDGDPSRIDATGRETIDAVIAFYGPRSGQWLSDLTHDEAPWREARVGIADGERGSVEISHASMAEYYGGLG